jgi:NAD(P)-dependent dehydrogenase (short-subunit alcohol dehydrogenase family)
MLVPEGRTEDGFERHLGTNYLGPFVLTTLLLPQITGRVVSISSQLHKRGKIHLDDLNGDHRPARCRPTATPNSPPSCSAPSCNDSSTTPAARSAPSPPTQASPEPT